LDKEGWRVAPGWFENSASTSQIGAIYLAAASREKIAVLCNPARKMDSNDRRAEG